MRDWIHTGKLGAVQVWGDSGDYRIYFCDHFLRYLKRYLKDAKHPTIEEVREKAKRFGRVAAEREKARKKKR